MEIVDLGAEIYDGQRSHFNVTIRNFLSHADTVARLSPPAQGFATRLIQLCDHTATHVDAPAHFYPEGATIDRVGIEAFWGSAICLDFSADPPTSAPLDLDRFRKELDSGEVRLREGDILLIKILNQGDDVYRGISKSLSEYLVGCGIKALGVDRATPDDGADKTRPAHVNLLGSGIVIMEGLVNLGQLKNSRFTYFGLPLKLRGATGSPIRPIAVIE